MCNDRDFLTASIDKNDCQMTVIFVFLDFIMMCNDNFYGVHF